MPKLFGQDVSQDVYEANKHLEKTPRLPGEAAQELAQLRSPKQTTAQMRERLRQVLDDKRDEAQHRGATNKAAGEAFQQELDMYHASLQRDGLAVVHRTDPPTRYIGDGRWVVVGKGPVDYIAFTGFGVVVFDAKVRAGQAYSISGGDGSDLHQLGWLRSVAPFVAAAGYLVRWTAADEVRWHDVDSVDGQRVRMADGVAVEGVRWYNCLNSD